MTKSIPLIAALLVGSVILPANAALVLSVSPVSQTVNLGDQVSIDVLFRGLESDGLDEIVSGYDLTLSFDDSILSYSSGTYFDLIDFAPAPDFSVSGEISWDSGSFEDDTVLQGQQDESVILASLVFDTSSTGTAALSVTFYDVLGLDDQTLSHSVDDGSVTVNGVPAPATVVLMSLGILGMSARHRKAKG